MATTSWERLEKVIESTNMTVNAFASSIGLKRAENLYRIKKGKNEISKELAEIITSKYCTFSKAWLLTGEGAMYTMSFGKDNEEGAKKIPFYDSILVNLEMENKEISSYDPLYYLEVPTLLNCDFAALFVGDSMSPEISSGSVVALKEIEMSLLIPGEMYFIITSNYSTIRYVRSMEDDPSKIRLVPKNTAAYDEFVLDKSLVLRLFLVKGVISTKIM